MRYIAMRSVSKDTISFGLAVAGGCWGLFVGDGWREDPGTGATRAGADIRDGSGGGESSVKFESSN